MGDDKSEWIHDKLEGSLAAIAADVSTIKERQATNTTILQERCKSRLTRIEGLEDSLYGNGHGGVKKQVTIMWWVFGFLSVAVSALVSKAAGIIPWGR